MTRLLSITVLAACASAATTEPAPSPTPNLVTGSAPARGELVARELAAAGSPYRAWLLPGREANLDRNDPCCGISYDGNRYDETLATCAIRGDECEPGRTAVYPGLADDRVCGERRRCVPYPLARVIVRDGTPVRVLDVDDNPVPTGADPARVAHGPVVLGRGGFLDVMLGARTEHLALDHGARYTVYVEGGRVARVTLD